MDGYAAASGSPRLTVTDLQASLQDLRGLGVELFFDRGSVLWHEGEIGDHCVFVLDGAVEIVHDGPDGTVIFRTLRAGTLVGEMACLDGLPRSATVRTSEPTRVLRIGAPELRSLLRLRPD